MLRLVYTKKRDRFQEVSVLGDASGIRDLYWQLTHNYRAQDGTEIGGVKVFDLHGRDCTADVMTNPHGVSTRLSTLA